MLKQKLKNILLIPPFEILEKYKTSKLRKRANNQISNYLKQYQVKKLQIGSGGTILEGWLNTDLFLENDKIVFLDAGNLFPIPNDSFDFIYSEHLFEHLTFEQQLNYLHESYRILKPGGKIRIATPNFDFLIALTNKNRNETQHKYVIWNYNHFLPKMSKVYNDEPNKEVYVINNYFKAWGHQLIHNIPSLTNLILHVGFKNVTSFDVSKSTDKSLENLEHHMSQLGVEFNILETMILEATKEEFR